MQKAILTVLAVFALMLFGCDEDETYEFQVENNGTEIFYIECWEEITVEWNYIGPGESGEITLGGEARQFEYVQLCIENDHCTQYAIGNYDTFYVVINADNSISMDE